MDDFHHIDRDVAANAHLLNAILVSENAVLRTRIESLEARLEASERIVQRIRAIARYVVGAYSSFAQLASVRPETVQIELTGSNGGPGEHVHMRTDTGARDPLATLTDCSSGPPSPEHDSSMRSTSFV